MDAFKIVARESKKFRCIGDISVSPSTFDRLVAVRERTDASINQIVDQCIAFAFDRLESGGNAE
jgi:hypothetical protein